MDIIIKINNIIKKLFDKKNVFIYLSNDNSLDIFFKNKIQTNKIKIIHRLNISDFNIFINELKTNFTIKNIDDKLSYSITKDDTLIICEYGNKEYYITLTFDYIKAKKNPLLNIYINLNDNNLYIVESNNMLPVINNFDEFFTINAETLINLIINDFEEFINIAVINILYHDNNCNLIISNHCSKILNDKKIRKNIKNNYESNSDYNLNSISFLIEKLCYHDKINEWIAFLNKNKYINKIINEIELFLTYGYKIKSTEEYYLFLILNKIKIPDEKFVKFGLDKIKKNIDDDFEFYNYDDIIDSFDKLKQFELDDIFIDKLKDYRKIKKISIPNKYEKLCNTLKNKINSKIKSYIHILLILFFYENNISYDLFPIKIAYIYKRYAYFGSDNLKYVFNIYNNIINNIGLNNYIYDDNYFYKLYNSKKIKDFDINKSLEIPIIRKKHESDEDSIDIIDFQDAFGILYEFLYINNVDLENLSISDLNDFFDAQLENIRSNKIFSKEGTNIFDEILTNSLSESKKNKFKTKSKQKNYLIKNDEEPAEINLDSILVNLLEKINKTDENDGDDENDMDNYSRKNNDMDELDEEVDLGDIQDVSKINLKDRNISEIDTFDDNEYDENEDSKINMDEMKELMYKMKYCRYKNDYSNLKKIEKILKSQDFDSTILDNYDCLTDELIKLLLVKYNHLTSCELDIDT